MAKEVNKSQFVAIKSMFMTGSVKRMKDIDTIAPTLVAKSIKMNYSRYVSKLYKPEEFTIKQIIAFANLVDLHPQIVLDVILKQNTASIKAKKNN